MTAASAVEPKNLTRGQIENWLSSLDDYGNFGDGHWVPTREAFEKLCNLALSSIIFGMTAEVSATRQSDVRDMPAVLAFDSFLNEPPEYEDKRMVRDYRHMAYPKWVKVLDEIRALLSAPQPGAQEAVCEVSVERLREKSELRGFREMAGLQALGNGRHILYAAPMSARPEGERSDPLEQALRESIGSILSEYAANKIMARAQEISLDMNNSASKGE